MTTVSVLEFRKDAAKIIRRLEQGQRMILSYRGRPVARMEPWVKGAADADDPIYSLASLAIDGEACTNEEMDRVIYEA